MTKKQRNESSLIDGLISFIFFAAVMVAIGILMAFYLIKI